MRCPHYLGLLCLGVLDNVTTTTSQATAPALPRAAQNFEPQLVSAQHAVRCAACQLRTACTRSGPKCGQTGVGRVLQVPS